MENIQKVGFKVRSTGHNYGWLIVNGRKDLEGSLFSWERDIPSVVANKIRGQLKLSQKDFVELINCPLTYEDYLNILKQKGIVY